MDIETLYLGLEVTLYGLGGVFAVLILFYVITKTMVAIANKYTKNKEE
jgi:Na+-transporting methylmalonyl-CoA/oxaloacetate decarboxylase gamma subunit